MYQTFSFKPYAAYDAPAATARRRAYRVWESIRGNHTIGRSWPGSQPAVDASGSIARVRWRPEAELASPVDPRAGLWYLA